MPFHWARTGVRIPSERGLLITLMTSGVLLSEEGAVSSRLAAPADFKEDALALRVACIENPAALVRGRLDPPSLTSFLNPWFLIMIP